MRHEPSSFKDVYCLFLQMCFLNRVATVNLVDNYSKHQSKFSLTLSFTENNYLNHPTLLSNMSSEVEEGDWVALVCNVEGKYRLNFLTKYIMDRLFETSTATILT